MRGTRRPSAYPIRTLLSRFFGLKQSKLAAGILAGVAKAGDQAGIATAIDLALKATDFGETLRTQDPVAVALRDVSAKLEEATRKALSGEFGAGWESKPDLAATLAALPDVLECYAPDTDAIFAENLDPERIARRATDAAEAAHDDLFRRNAVGERLLFAVVRQTYSVALANKDFALQMILRGQGETLNRLDQTAARISRLEELLSGNHPAARALQEIRDTLRPNVPDIQGITDEHLPSIVRRILEEARKPGTDPADFSGAVRRALEQARVHITNLEFATAARLLDAQLAQIDAEGRDRAREHAALLSERGRVSTLQLRYLDAAAFHKQAAALMAFDQRAAWGHTMEAAGVLCDHGREFGENQALHDSIAAYSMALDLVSRERVPLDWAMTQNNLGTALSTLGERESGTARLEEAVAAYREALEERTRERVPLDWAMTQNNLGNALCDARRARERHGAAGGGGRGLPRGAGGIDARARAARLGDDAEQPRHRACDARRARERHGAAGRGGRGLPRRAAGKHARARAARLGDDAEQPRQRAPDARRARERHGAAGRGGRAYREALQGIHARARAARMGDDAEQPRHRALRGSANARAARRGWKRRSRPTATR